MDDAWVGRRVLIDPIASVVPFDIRRLSLHQRTLIGSTMHTRSDFAELAAIATAGGVEPIVADTFALTEIARAQERFVAKDFVGKLVIEPRGSVGRSFVSAVISAVEA